MKLIIDIPEEKYKTIQEGMYCGMLDADLYRDIKNGTPLDDLRAKIEEPLKINEGMHTESAKAQAIALSWCIEIIDNYRGDADEMS